MANKNSRIISRIDRTGKVRTETTRRDAYELDFAITTDTRNNSTRLFIDGVGRREGFRSGGADLELTGHQARALYTALERHFAVTGK